MISVGDVHIHFYVTLSYARTFFIWHTIGQKSDIFNKLSQNGINSLRQETALIKKVIIVIESSQFRGLLTLTVG